MDGQLVLFSQFNRRTVYPFPVGSGDIKAALEAAANGQGTVIDCDEVYHRLLAQDTAMLSAIAARFPGTVESGTLDRKKLGSIVFANGQALLDLNKITHSAVKEEVLQMLPAFPSLVAIDAIALFESGLATLCDVTVAITAPEDVRIQRIMARDNISYDYAKRNKPQNSGKITGTQKNSF